MVTSNVSPGLQFTIADRFNGHKVLAWLYLFLVEMLLKRIARTRVNGLSIGGLCFSSFLTLHSLISPFQQQWEGSGFPMDVCRPIGNIYHSKLAIAVDWIVFVDNAQRNGNNNIGGGSGERDVRVMTPVSSGIAAGLFQLQPFIFVSLRSPVFPIHFVNFPPMFLAYWHYY